VDVSEDELIRAIRRVLSGAGPDVIVPVGDDAAVVRPGSGDIVLTTDALVEGAHFLRASTTPHDLGAKAIVVNVSDIAAMGGSPRFALCALTLSDEVDAAWTMELFGGMREACDGYACTLVGGNLARGPEVTIAVTVTGEVAPGRAVTRSGARPGDRIVVTADLSAIHHADRPVARVGEAHVLARHGVTAMIDVSDGLTSDLSRICEASGVGAEFRVADLPAGPRALPEEVLGGGEDYELIATLPDPDAVTAAGRELDGSYGVPLAEIGVVVDGEGLTAVALDGARRRVDPSGWDHFA
jgi:thiamine-monophosphate kinase